MAKKINRENSVSVADWMSKPVLAVETYDSIGLARRLMAKRRVNQLPVLDEDRLVGIVTDRDIRDAYPTSMMINRGKKIDEFAEKITVEEVMSHGVFVVHPETTLQTAVRLLRKHRIGALPVVIHKAVVGIITRSDILDYVLRGGGKKNAKPRKAGALRQPLPKRK